jgi:hypothetical protein
VEDAVRSSVGAGIEVARHHQRLVPVAAPDDVLDAGPASAQIRYRNV